MDLHPTPPVFLEFIVDKTKGWSATNKAAATYITEWALAACGAPNEKSKGESQLGVVLSDFNLMTEIFDDWMEARLIHNL